MIQFWQINYFNIGPITVYTWGLLTALGFLFGWLVVRKRLVEIIGSKKSSNLLPLMILGALLGARLGYVVQFPNYYLSHPAEIIAIWAGGLTFYGGFIGAGLFLTWYLRRENWLKVFDALTPGLALGLVFGRIGCSLINDHIGSITSLPWGIIYLDGQPRHPVAWYLIVSNLILFFILLGLRRQNLKTGQLTKVFLVYYSLSRIVLDFTRARDLLDVADPIWFGLSTAQWLSLAALIIGIFFYRKLEISKNKFIN